MEQMRVRKPKYPQPEPEEPKKEKVAKKKQYKNELKSIALVHEFPKGSGGMSSVKTHIVDINERWYIDIRNYKIYTKNGEDEEFKGKGICLSIEFIPELKAAIAAVEKYLKETME